MPTDYVKCYTTKIDAGQSQGDIISLLHRYGASGFGFHRRGSVIECTFHIPDDAGGDDRTVVIPIDVDRVAAKLSPKLLALRKARKERTDAEATGAAQAERVAWRILLDWIDASLAAVSIGAQTVEEAFHAHMVVTTADGHSGRAIDYFHTIQGGTSDGRLPSINAPFGERRQLKAGGA